MLLRREVFMIKQKSRYHVKVKGMRGGGKFKKNNGSKKWAKTRRKIDREEMRAL